MIDKQVFADGMGQLGGAFGREIDGPVSRMYYTLLSPKLTTEQFAAAVTKTLATERFWPSPAVLLDKAGMDAEGRAHAAFQAMQDAVRTAGGFRFMPYSVYEAFDAPTRAGIKAVGGLAEIAGTTTERWPALVKRFCKAYQDALSPTPALPSGERVQPQVREMVAKLALVRGGQDNALPAGDRE